MLRSVLAGCTVVAPKPLPDLWLALEHGDVDRVATLLRKERSVDALGGPYGSTPLGWAAFAGDVALVQLLLNTTVCNSP